MPLAITPHGKAEIDLIGREGRELAILGHRLPGTIGDPEMIGRLRLAQRFPPCRCTYHERAGFVLSPAETIWPYDSSCPYSTSVGSLVQLPHYDNAIGINIL